MSIILIDDDPLCVHLTEKLLKFEIRSEEIYGFTEPELSLTFIKEKISAGIPDEQILIFLDLNMPTMTGWEVLDELESWGDLIGDKLKVFILSSSVSEDDIRMTKEHWLAQEFISKPLNTAIITEKILPHLEG